MPIRKKPYLGEIIEIIGGHEVVEVSENSVTVEVTRFKGNEPVGEGRMDIPIEYLEFCKDRKIFFLKKEHLDWFEKEKQKLNL